MSDEIASTSLLPHISESGFRSSIFSTFNCYFPFYEDVILRRLIAAGCTHNLLMVDATCCAEAFAFEELRPRRAGRDYTLIPVKLGGAFHPKMFLRFGRSKGSLLVGSHNVTLSGFGLNDEVTNVFRVEGTALRSDAILFRQALSYLEQFVPARLAALVDAFEGVKLGIQWLEGSAEPAPRDYRLLMASDSSADLWSQIVPLIPRSVTTLFVGGPFFDQGLTMVRRLQREVQPRRMVIGIDPASVDINPTDALKIKNVNWVNIANVPQIPHRREGASRYLHAKMFWFASKTEELLVTGSANPTAAAFFAPPAARNAEAVVADRRHGAAARLGVEALLDAPPVTRAEWSEVATRQSEERPKSGEDSRRILVATPSAEGFMAQEPLAAGLIFDAVGDLDVPLGEAIARSEGVIEAAEAIRDSARYLSARSAKKQTLVVIHKPEEIARNIGDDTRKALRQALGALEEDPTQIEALLKLTEKVIFDSDDLIRATPLKQVGVTDVQQRSVAAPTTLALRAAGKKGSQVRKRSLASGDIVVLLDALLRRLGEGIPVNPSQRSRSEEEEIGADEEEGGEIASGAPDFEALAKACCAKVRRLVQRMKQQLELAKAPDQARRGVVQLSAVLSILRMLRVAEQRPEWKRMSHQLVDRHAEWDLFCAASLAVFWGEDAMAARAIAEADGEGFLEVSEVTGLLAWLAWVVETDISIASRRGGLEGLENEQWYAVQLLATLGPWLVEDPTALKILEDGVARTPRFPLDGGRWLSTHLSALKRYASVTAAQEKLESVRRRVRPGDLVALQGREAPRVRIALDVRPGKGGDKVVVLAPDAPEGKRSFMASRTVTLAWEIGVISGAAVG